MAIPATPPEKMSFWEHLQELRVRIVRSLLAVAVIFALTYAWRFKLWAWAQKPFLEAMARQTGKAVATLDPFAFTDLTEPFFSMMRLLWAAAFLSAPFLFYQVWAFIRPGLLPNAASSSPSSS
ncbi:MAG: twin-arginine translocase subunit TatC [Holophagaceae bacterium]|nr:twin-arginine translocase subunit TatC [Holophagaceae bacterium]